VDASIKDSGARRIFNRASLFFGYLGTYGRKPARTDVVVRLFSRTWVGLTFFFRFDADPWEPEESASADQSKPPKCRNTNWWQFPYERLKQKLDQRKNRRPFVQFAMNLCHVSPAATKIRIVWKQRCFFFNPIISVGPTHPSC